MMNVSKYLCSTSLYMAHRNVHQTRPPSDRSTSGQHRLLLVQHSGQHSSGYRTNTTLTSLTSGPSATLSVLSLGLAVSSQKTGLMMRLASLLLSDEDARDDRCSGIRCGSRPGAALPSDAPDLALAGRVGASVSWKKKTRIITVLQRRFTGISAVKPD